MSEKKDPPVLKGIIGRKVKENLDRIKDIRERKKRSRKNRKTVPVFMKEGGSQSTGSFMGDLMKAISAGGSSKLTKKVKVKKNDTLGSIAKANNTTIKMLQKLNPGLKGALGQKTMEFNKDTIRVPDPQSFQKGRLKPVRTTKKKNIYEGQTKADMAEMNRPIMDKASLKRQQEKVAKTKDRNAPKAIATAPPTKEKVASRRMGGTMVKKMNMGGVMKNRGGTFKGIY